MNNKIQNVDNVEVMRILEMHSKEGYKTPLLTEQAASYSKWPSCVLTHPNLKKSMDPRGPVYIYDNGQGTTWSLFLGSADKDNLDSQYGGNIKYGVRANSVYFDNKPKGYQGWTVWYCEGNQIKIQKDANTTYGLKVLDKKGTSLSNGKLCLSNYYNTLVTMGNGRPAYKIISNDVNYYIYGDDEAIYNDGSGNKKLDSFYCNVETKHFTSSNKGEIPFNTQEGSKRPTESCTLGHPYIVNINNNNYQYTKGGFTYILNRNDNHMKVVSGGGTSSDPTQNTWKCIGNQIEITLYKTNGNLMGTYVLEGESTGKSTSPQPVKDNISNTGGNKKQKSNSPTSKKTENKPAPSAFVSAEVGP